MKDVIIIQHCQSEHHVNDLTGGWTDTPLTSLGKKQAFRVAKRINDIQNIDQYKIYSSDLLRAKQTAEVVNEEIHIPLIIDKRLREINNGDGAWKTKEWAHENRKKHPLGKFDIDLKEFDNAETWRDFFIRISSFMQNIHSLEEKNIILVTHGCALNYIISWWMHFDIGLLEKSYFTASPGSISILSSNGHGQNALKLLNCTKHLFI